MKRVLSAVAVLFQLAAGPAFAQSSVEANAGLQFDFLNPGAYSLGMGGAFIGGADDATAAYANPAGLVNLSRPEVSLETRMWQNDHVVPYRGHAFGTASQEEYDVVDGIEERIFTKRDRGLTFASLVYPSNRWAVAVYQHEIAHFNSSSETGGIFFTDPNAGNGTPDRRQRPTRSDLRLRIVSRGAAFGFRLTPVLSLGVDISSMEFSLDSRTDQYRYTRYFAPDFQPENILNVVSQHGKANRIRSGGGVTWNVSSRLRLGAVYRHEPSFPVTVTDLRLLEQTSTDCGARFHIPDVYGTGISFRPSAFLTVNADYNRVRYSELTRDFVTFPETAPCTTEARARDFVTRDGNEYHAGIRYAMARKLPFLERHPLVATAGWWREAPHAIEHNDPLSPASLLFAPGRPDHHYSAAIGILLTNRLQFSVGADVSSRQKIISVSTLHRW